MADLIAKKINICAKKMKIVMKLPDMLTLSTVDHDYGKKRWFCLLSKLRDRALQLIMGHVVHGLEVVASLASTRL